MRLRAEALNLALFWIFGLLSRLILAGQLARDGEVLDSLFISDSANAGIYWIDRSVVAPFTGLCRKSNNRSQGGARSRALPWADLL